MNRAINKGYMVKFQHCILYIQQFEILGNFEKATFPLLKHCILYIDLQQFKILENFEKKKKKKKKKKKNFPIEINDDVAQKIHKFF